MRIRSAKTIDKINDGVKNCEPFVAASVSGEFISYDPFGSWLPDSEADILRDHAKNSHNGKVFAVFSYGTPIAWKNGDEWYVPNKKYTASTTHHQSLVRSAIYLANS